MILPTPSPHPHPTFVCTGRYICVHASGGQKSTQIFLFTLTFVVFVDELIMMLFLR